MKIDSVIQVAEPRLQLRAASTQQTSQQGQPSSVVTISDEAKKMVETPPDKESSKLTFEDDGHHLSNKNYAGQAQDPIFKRIL